MIRHQYQQSINIMEANQQCNSAFPASPITRQLRWSARLKHSDTEIHGKKLGCTSYSFYKMGCLTDCINEPTISRKSKWAVRINSLKYQIYVGICQISHAQSHKFEYWNWFPPGHYYIVSNDPLFSCSTNNKKQQSFEFDTGDVLYFEYDCVIGSLDVTNTNGEHLGMNVQKRRKYAVCVYLKGEGDSVELMD